VFSNFRLRNSALPIITLIASSCSTKREVGQNCVRQRSNLLDVQRRRRMFRGSCEPALPDLLQTFLRRQEVDVQSQIVRMLTNVGFGKRPAAVGADADHQVRIQLRTVSKLELAASAFRARDRGWKVAAHDT
jgi:hypothetical protein